MTRLSGAFLRLTWASALCVMFWSFSPVRGYAQPEPVTLHPGVDDAEGAMPEEALQRVLNTLPGLLRESRWSEAIETVNASALEPADAMALRGFVLLQSNSPELARQEFLNALEARPERYGIWLYVAQCSLALGDITSALQAYRLGLTAGREIPAAWVLGAQIEILGNNWFRAWDVLNVAEHRFGPLPDAVALKTQMLAQLNVRWAMLLWQMTPSVGGVEACSWWRLANRFDDALGTPTQGMSTSSSSVFGLTAWTGTTGLWATACDVGQRRIRRVSQTLGVLQGGGDSTLGERIRRLAGSGECERALVLASVEPASVSPETQAWLDWCSSGI